MPTRRSSGIIFKQEQFVTDPGTAYNDVSRNHHTCTPTALDYTELPSGLWVPTFDGADTKVDTGSDWIGDREYSIGCWFYVDGDSSVNNVRILENGQFIINIISSGRLNVSSDRGGTSIQSDYNESWRARMWYNLFITRSISGTGAIYSDGVLVESGATGTPAIGTTNIFIGNITGGDRPFPGYIDDLTVYSYIPAAPTTFAVARYNESALLYGKALI